MLARLVAGYVLALSVIVPLAARSALGLPGYTIAVTMQAAVPGYLQVFYDAGEGFSELRSASAPLQTSDEPHVYRLELPAGRYRSLRIDPGTAGGRYAIEQILILAPDGSRYAAIPIPALAAAYQLSVLEQTRNRLLVEAPPGSNDPQLLYTPDAPVVVPERLLSPLVLWILVQLALLWLLGTLIVWLVEVLLRTLWPTLGHTADRVVGRCNRNPRAVICITAIFATLVATYPIVFLGRSLVSPNNHGTPLLYGDAPPFAPGDTDLVRENVRGSDVWAGILQEVPHSDVQREALAQGEVPLWNRYNAGGRPLWGQGLTSLLDPLHWLTMMTPDPALGWDLKFVGHRMVFATGIGLAGLATTGSWPSAVIVAAASPFIGHYAFRLNHPASFTLTYCPWILLAWFTLADAHDWRRKAVASILLALSSALVLVAGTPKEAAVALLGVESIGMLTVLISPGSRRERVCRLLAAAVAGISALLIASPHWLVFLDTLAESYTVYEQPFVQFARRREAIGFFLGPLAPGPLQPGLHLVGLVLIAAAVTGASRLREKRSLIACGIGAGVLIAIAFGAVPASAIVRTPLMGNIGHINDVLLAASLPPLLLLAAYGAETLLSANNRRTALVCALAGAACVWLFANARIFARTDSLESLPLFLLIPIAVALPVCFYETQRGAHRALGWVAIALASFVLLLPGGLHASTNIPVLDDLLLQPRQRTPLDRDSPMIEALHHASTEPFRAAGADWTLFGGSQSFYELEGIGGADPLEVRAYRELVDAGGLWRTMGWITIIPSADISRLAPLLDLLNVRFLILPVPSPDRVKVETRTTAWPRAFFVDGVTSYEDARDLMLKVASAGKPLAAVQSNDREAMDATHGISAVSNNVSAASDYKVTANATRFSVRASGPGVAVLSETYIPRDFDATLNGRRVSYFRVNHTFKAVAIPAAGEWVVRFEYLPHHWNLSLKMAGAGLLVLLGFAVSARRPRHFVEPTVNEKPAARASS